LFKQIHNIVEPVLWICLNGCAEFPAIKNRLFHPNETPIVSAFLATETFCLARCVLILVLHIIIDIVACSDCEFKKPLLQLQGYIVAHEIDIRFSHEIYQGKPL